MPVNFDPEPVVQPVASAVARLPHLSNAPFVLMFHPMRWSWAPELAEFVPNLGRMIVEPGVGAVLANGDSALAESIKAKRHWTMVPWHMVPDGFSGGSYMRRQLAKGPAGNDWYYHEVWETPRHIAGQVMSSVVDEKGRRDWLRWLVTSGRLPAISDEARELLSARLGERIQRLEGRTDVGPRVEAARAQLDAMAGPKRRTKGATA